MSNVWGKLDIGLSSIYSNYLKVREHGPLSVSRVHPIVAGGGKLAVALDYSGDLAEIEALGFRTLAHNAPGLASGAIGLEDVERLAAHPRVQKISFGEEREPNLHVSVPEIRARKVAPADGVWTLSPAGVFSGGGQTGAGVIVGIIDSGIDFRHPFFLKTDTPQTTRILRIWDPGIDPHDGLTSPTIALLTGGTGAAGGTYGVEYKDNHINDVLQRIAGAPTVKHRDCIGHGTHVASIAAGDGRTAFTHVGVAPQADLVIVKFLSLQKKPEVGAVEVNEDFRFLDAVSYILNFASSLARPVVINFSVGTTVGPHDGLTRTEDFLTHTFSGAIGKVFVAAAGNSSGVLPDLTPARQHARIVFPAGGGTVDIPLQLYDPRTNRRDFHKCIWDNATKDLILDLYYPAGVPNITAAIDLPDDGIGFRNGPAAFPGREGPLSFSGRQCTMFHVPDDQPLSFTGRGTVTRKRFLVTVEPFRNRHVLGRYTLRVTSSGPAAFTAHLWCGQARGHGFRVALPPAVIPPNVFVEDRFQAGNGAAGIVTVAAYDAAAPGRDIAHFSSRGPVANHGGLPVGVTQPVKPDLGAPGVKVRAAKSRDARPRQPGSTVQKGGTSMAAPHVTGLVALMLQKKPTLTFIDVVLFLMGQTRLRQGTETVDDIGAGRIDAKNTVDHTP